MTVNEYIQNKVNSIQINTFDIIEKVNLLLSENEKLREENKQLKEKIRKENSENDYKKKE